MDSPADAPTVLLGCFYLKRLGCLQGVVKRARRIERTRLSGFTSSIALLPRLGCLETSHTFLIFHNVILSFSSNLFFARPKKRFHPASPRLRRKSKKGRPAPRFSLLVPSVVEGRVAKTGGALSNAAPAKQGHQTAKGPVSARFCDACTPLAGLIRLWRARRGTMGKKLLLGAVLFTFFHGLTPRKRKGDLMTLCAV